MSAKAVETTIDQLTSTYDVHKHHGHVGVRSRRAQAGAFLRHLLEMTVSMFVGMVALYSLYRFAVGQLGYTNPYLQLPELTLLAMALSMTLPMAAWMRFRGMDWRSIAEMSAAMIGEAVLIIAGYWLGILPNAGANGNSTLSSLQHSLMMPAMLVPMLLRLDVYTGHKHHTA